MCGETTWKLAPSIDGEVSVTELTNCITMRTIAGAPGSLCRLRFQHPAQRPRKVPVNKNGFAIDAITCDVRDIIIMADRPHSPAEGFDHVKKHRIVDVFGFVAQFFR